MQESSSTVRTYRLEGGPANGMIREVDGNSLTVFTPPIGLAFPVSPTKWKLKPGEVTYYAVERFDEQGLQIMTCRHA